MLEVKLSNYTAVATRQSRPTKTNFIQYKRLLVVAVVQLYHYGFVSALFVHKLVNLRQLCTIMYRTLLSSTIGQASDAMVMAARTKHETLTSRVFQQTKTAALWLGLPLPRFHPQLVGLEAECHPGR